MTIRETLRADLTTAMRERRRENAAAIRTLLAAIDNAEAVPLADDAKPADCADFGAAETPRRVLSEAEIAAIIATEITARNDAAGQMRAHGAEAEALRLEVEAEMLRARYSA